MTTADSREDKAEASTEKVLKALNWAPPKKITQEAFDESVQDNIDALGLDGDEAVESAIEEFLMQKVDLSDIIQTPEGADISGHPVQRALADLQAAADSPDAATEFPAAAAAFAALLTGSEDLSQQEALAVAHRAGALKALFLLLKAGKVPEADLVTVLGIGTALLQVAVIRDSFAEKSMHDGVIFDGPNAAGALLRTHGAAPAVVAATARLCEAAATECEASKCKVMESIFPGEALKVLGRPGVDLTAAVALCDALKALLYHDDFRGPTSKTFVHARVLAGELAAVPVMLRVLASSVHEPRDFKSILLAVQQLCANDDICKQVCDGNGVQLVLDANERYFADATVVAATMGLLRQLAKSDDIKIRLVRLNGLERIVSILDTHKSSSKVMTQTLGLLATLLLRQPEHCDRAYELDGLVDQVLDTMRAHADVPGPNRQACQVLRNMVVRNKDLAPLLMDRGVEAILRHAKTLDEVDDVATGALRDLGCEKYLD